MKTTKEKIAEAIAKKLGNGMSEKYEIHAQAALDVVCEELESAVDTVADKLEFHLPLKHECRTNYVVGAQAALKAAADRLRG
jgi:hypothetical protein